MTEYLNVGKIVNTHGIRGEVRVISQTDFPEERYRKGAELTLFRENKEPLPLIVSGHRKHKNFDLLTFEGYPNINDVEPFRNGILKVTKDDLVDLAENEFYYHEIIGLKSSKKMAQSLVKSKRSFHQAPMMFGWYSEKGRRMP